MWRRRFVATAVLTVAVFAGRARATEPFAAIKVEVITSPLTTPRSARNQSMGGAGVADAATPANAIYNPANLIGDDGVFAFYDTYRHYDFFDVYDSGVAATKTWQGRGIRGAVAVRQVFHNYDPVVERTVFLPEGTGSTFEPKDRGTAVAVACSVPIGGGDVSLGASVARATRELVSSSVVAWAFDVGARMSFAPVSNRRGDRLDTHLAAAVLNAGNGFDFGSNIHADSPRQIRAGAGARFALGTTVAAPFAAREVSGVAVAVDLDVVTEDPRNDDVTALAGIELALFETIYLRAGSGGRVIDQNSGISRGAGIAVDTGPLRFHADVTTYPLISISDDHETIYSLALDYRP